VLPAAGGGLRGTVRGPDGRGVAGAIVSLAQSPRSAAVLARARTDTRGEFQIAGLAAGEREVSVRAPELATAMATVRIEAGQETAVALDLAAGVTIEGRIAEGEDLPAAGVKVAAGAPPGLGYTVTTTAADGTYVLHGLAPGEIALRAGGASVRGSRGLAEGRLTARAGERLRWDARLALGLTIRGRVLDEDGRALSGAIVAGSIAGSPGRPGHRDSARTDAEGRFELKNWKDADTRLTVTADVNELFPRACVDGVRAGPDEVVIALRTADRPSVRIRGVLLDADGRPATARLVPIPVSRPFELPGLGKTRIDPATGSFELGPLPAGWWLVRIDANGCPSCSIPARELAPGQTFDAGTVRLPRQGSLRVMAKGGDGGAIRKAMFEIGTADDAIVEHLAIENGAGRIALAPGRYLVQAQAEGCAAQCLPVEIAAGAESTLDVTFAPGVVHTLRFAAPAGGYSRILHEVIRDAEQRVVADGWLWAPCEREWKLGLAAGRYTLEATTPNGFRGTAAFTAAPGSEPTLVELR
jgi:protocatechuate 3,4-dioxygenase beta subunit